MRGLLWMSCALGAMILTGCGNSTEPTQVAITSPEYGSTVSGIITIQAEVTGSVKEVNFNIDGVEYGSDASAPYEYEWDTTHELNGTHSIKAEGRFLSGDRKSSEITVIVEN